MKSANKWWELNLPDVVQLLSCVWPFAIPWNTALQTCLSFTISKSLLMSGDSIQPCHPLLLPSPLAINLSQHQGLFQWVSSHQVAKVLEFQLHHQSLQRTFRTDFLLDSLAGSPCSPRGSQESSPTPQFKSINSSMLSLLYGPTLISIHDYWKNHSFDCMDLWWQSDVSAF